MGLIIREVQPEDAAGETATTILFERQPLVECAPGWGEAITLLEVFVQ